MKKVSNTQAELKKSVAYKKTCIRAIGGSVLGEINKTRY